MDQTIEGVLAQLTALKGVNHAGVYSDRHGLFSTLPAGQQAGIGNAARMIGQIFAALRSIDMAHNEVYVEFDDILIAAYEIPDSILVLLSTERRINFPMVGMGVKSVAAKIRELLAKPAKIHDAATLAALLRPIEATPP